MASNPIQMIESEVFTRRLSPYRLQIAILHHDLRLSAEESVIARQKMMHYRTRTLYPCIYMTALLEGELRS